MLLALLPAAILAAILVSPLLLPSLAVAEEPVLVVHFHHRPPYYVDMGGSLGGTVGTVVSRALRQAGVRHRFELTPPKRQIQILKENLGCDCAVGWFRTPERERFARFSAPLFRGQPMAVLVRADDPHLPEIESLEGLLALKGMTLLVRDGYSYGTVIDGLLASLGTPMATTSAESRNMVRMIHAGRADYMFLSPEEAGPLLRAANIPQSELRLIALPGMPPGNLRYLMYSTSVPEGIITRIDEAIRRITQLEEGP
jgi:polar amino acid transport system substrate-binding protein